VSRTTTELLTDALSHFELALEYSRSSESTQMAVDAMCLRLAAGIEALGRLDESTRSELFGDDWLDMWGIRNRIAHGYTLVNLDIIRETMAVDVPAMAGAIEDALNH
jgi:uncharacterized protein with HEPN domain